MSTRLLPGLSVSAIFAILTLGLLSAPNRADEPVEAPLPAKRYLLRYKYQPNDLVYYEVQQQSRVTVKGPGLQEENNNRTTEKKHYRVINVDSKGAGLLELAIDHVVMRAQFDKNKPIEFDSRKKEPPPPEFGNVRELIGKPRARMRFSARGELNKVVLLSKGTTGKFGQLANAPQTAANDPSHNFLVVFPENSVTVGETWSNKISVQVRVGKSLLRPVTLLRKYTLKSVERNLATIESNTTILTAIRDPKIRTQLIQRTPSGKTVFDLERGLIVSRTKKINQRQIGGITANSSMHVVSLRTERLLQ